MLAFTLPPHAVVGGVGSATPTEMIFNNNKYITIVYSCRLFIYGAVRSSEE